MFVDFQLTVQIQLIILMIFEPRVHNDLKYSAHGLHDGLFYKLLPVYMRRASLVKLAGWFLLFLRSDSLNTKETNTLNRAGSPHINRTYAICYDGDAKFIKHLNLILFKYRFIHNYKRRNKKYQETQSVNNLAKTL